MKFSVFVEDLNSSMNIIDIREEYEYLSEHIPGSKHISYKNLIFSPEMYLDKYKTYYIYCSMGVRSRSLVNRLNDLGYKLKNIEGGFMEYKSTR